jgi:hypothetical protein
MTDAVSFIYVPDDDRLRERADRFGRLTDVFRSSEVHAARQVALVSWEGDYIDGCAVMTTSGRVASYKTRVRLTHYFDGIAVEVKALARQLPKAARERFRVALNGGGQLDGETTAAVRKVLVDRHPDAAAAWELAESEAHREPPELWPNQGVPAVAYERDAVGLALSIAGISREDVMSNWDGDTHAPFLQGLSEFRAYEDAAIAHDTTVFGKWKGLGPSVIGVARFQDRGRHLTVINANRTPIENTLGCDLIYYIHDFNAYVLVQYKRLAKAAKGWEFRPDSDANFAKELERMRAIAAPARARDDPEHYRMGENFCFIKFCKPVTSEPFSGELSAGMYLPLDYFDSLVKADRLKGPKGGKVLTYENVGRWLNNSAFVGLVGRSWVGARGLTVRQLTSVLRRSLASKHSLILAEGDVLPPGPRRR